MLVNFFKDGRKTNTIKTKIFDKDGKEEEISTQQELKTFQFECPLADCTINMDAYSRGTEWQIYPIDNLPIESLSRDETRMEMINILERMLKILESEVKP